MLPARITRLLSAFIDGELSSRKRRAVKRLLARSSEARQLLKDLEQDSSEIRFMPRRRLDVDVSKSVLRSISDKQLAIKPKQTAPARRLAFPTWVGYAAAAAVLIAVFAGSYFYSLSFHAGQGDSPMANSNQPNDVAPNANGPNSTPHVPDVEQPKQQPKPDQPETLAPSVIVKKPETKKEYPPIIVVDRPVPNKPNEKGEPLVIKFPEMPVVEGPYTKPSTKMEVFEEVGNLPILSALALRDLERDNHQIDLLSRMQKGNAYRFELFSLGTSISHERLENVFNQFGIGLTIDELCLARIRNPEWKTDFAIYIENMKTEEVVALLTQLGQVDRKIEAVAMPFTTEDHKELSKLLGVNPTKLDPPKPVKIDVREPISKATLKQLRMAPPRPRNDGKPVITRHALVVPCNPVHPNPSASREIKKFLDLRSKREPGTVQVLFVVRGVSGN